MASTEYGSGSNRDKYEDPSSGNILDPGIFGGKLRCFQDTMTISASANLNSQSYFEVGPKLPTGAQVVKVVFGHAATSALGTQADIVVGDQGDIDRYLTCQISSGNGVVDGPNVYTGVNYVITGTTDNVIRVGGASDGARISTNTLKITVFYTVE